MSKEEFTSESRTYFWSRHERYIGNVMTELEPSWTSKDLMDTLAAAYVVPLPSYAELT